MYVKNSKGWDEYWIKFEHKRYVFGSDYRGITRCIIHALGVELGMGNALCSPDDQFNKSIGRKIALKRALKNAQIPRRDRGLIWAKYFETHKK